MESLNHYLERLQSINESEQIDDAKAKEITTLLIKEKINSKDLVEKFLNAFGVSPSVKTLVLANF